MSGEGNSKLTEPRVTAALTALENGCTREAAAGAAGVTRTTFYRWMDDVAFRDAVEKAEALAEAKFTAAVVYAVPKSWQAAAWWLERRRYQSYARRDQVEMRIDIKAEVRKLAEELGLDADAAIAEVEAILGSRSS